LDMGSLKALLEKLEGQIGTAVPKTVTTENTNSKEHEAGEEKQLSNTFSEAESARPERNLIPQTVPKRPEIVIDASSQLSQQEVEESLKILSKKDLLFGIGEGMQKIGIAGEKRNALAVYLCLTSRILEKPISLLVKGESSAGKSYLVKKALQFFPDDAYKELTDMSKKALLYSNDSFSHRTVIIFEKHGMEAALYYIRTLQSEGKLVFETVEKDPVTKLRRTRRIEKEGPTNFIVTTTSAEIHPENETRNWSIFMDESEEQTREAKRKIAERYLDVHPNISFLKPYRNAQKLLKYYPVKIPYAAFLSESTPHKPLRMRRDFEKLLAAIEVITVLHEFQREVREDNGIFYLESTIEDYFIATSLFGPSFSQSLRDSDPKAENQKDSIFDSRRTGLPSLEDLAHAYPHLASDFSGVNPISGEEVSIE